MSHFPLLKNKWWWVEVCGKTDMLLMCNYDGWMPFSLWSFTQEPRSRLTRINADVLSSRKPWYFASFSTVYQGQHHGETAPLRFNKNCVCLVFCGWDGWVGIGWLGWVLFIKFWVWCWGYFFFLKFLWPSDSHFMHGVCDLNYACFFFFFFKLILFSYLCNICNTIVLLRWGLVVLFCMFSLPHQTQV